MDVDDAIIRAIIQGNKRYGHILSASEKICKMSRATFDNHLKHLQKNQYIKREINNKIIEYKINQNSIQAPQEVLSKKQKNNSLMCVFIGGVFFSCDITCGNSAETLQVFEKQL